MFTFLKIVVIVAIAALAFHRNRKLVPLQPNTTPARLVARCGFVLAVTAALWAFDGCSDLNMVAEEVRSPEKNIPLALLGGFSVSGRALHVGQLGSAISRCPL